MIIYMNVIQNYVFKYYIIVQVKNFNYSCHILMCLQYKIKNQNPKHVIKFFSYFK